MVNIITQVVRWFRPSPHESASLSESDLELARACVALIRRGDGEPRADGYGIMPYCGQATIGGAQLIWSGPHAYDLDVKYGRAMSLSGLPNAYYFVNMVNPLGVIDGDRSIWGTLWR